MYWSPKNNLKTDNNTDFNLVSGVLNEQYTKLSPEERIKQFYTDHDEVLFTSSFGTTAVYLIDLLHEAGIKQKVHFIDTTFHFEETHNYKKLLTERYNLEVVDLKPDTEDNKYSRLAELWQYNPDQCCDTNKVKPLANVQQNYKYWISGLMSWQNPFRKNLNIFDIKQNIVKFYPIIDISENYIWNYIENKKLPKHPLLKKGYESVGCTHCTIVGEKRKGRWANTVKTECGLHL